MEFDNKNAYDRIRGKLAVVTIIFSGLIGLSILYDFFQMYLFNVNKWVYTSFFAFLFVLYLVYRAGLKYHFIIYNDEGGKIILRYYPLSSFRIKFLSVEIPYNALYKIEVNKVFFGLREEMTIYQTVKGKIAKYKPIPLSALSKKEKTNLINSLNKFAQVKMK